MAVYPPFLPQQWTCQSRKSSFHSDRSSGSRSSVLLDTAALCGVKSPVQQLVTLSLKSIRTIHNQQHCSQWMPHWADLVLLTLLALPIPLPWIWWCVCVCVCVCRQKRHSPTHTQTAGSGEDREEVKDPAGLFSTNCDRTVWISSGADVTWRSPFICFPRTFT